MKQINRKLKNTPETLSRYLVRHIDQLINNWRQAYKQAFPDDSSTIVHKLEEINISILADYLEGKDINCCDQYIGTDDPTLIKFGISQVKVVASFRMFLKIAQTFLRNQLSNPEKDKEIFIASEQLQFMELMVMIKSFAKIESEEIEKLLYTTNRELSSHQLEEYLQQLLVDTIRITSANGGKILLVDKDRPDRLRQIALVEKDKLNKIPKITTELNAVLKSGQPLFLYSNSDNKWKHSSPSEINNLRSTWIFPIKIKNEPKGVLILYFDRYNQCQIQEREIMEVLVERAAMIIDRTIVINSIRSDEQQIRELTERIIAVQNEESRRISRELHDETSGSLLVTKLYLEMIYKEVPRNLGSTRKKVKEAIGLVNKTLNEIRRLIADLGPAMLDDLGLIQSLKLHVKTIKDIFNIKVALKVSHDFPRLPRGVEVAIYRIIQESLNNAARHSQASKIDVQIKYQKDLVHIKIKDDGIGFNLTDIDSLKFKKSFGLVGMQERVSLLEGTLDIVSAPEQGTALIITLPTVTR